MRTGLVAITDENRRQIQSLIDVIPDDEVYHNFDDTPQPGFRSLNVLPVMFDSGGASVLRPDGEWKAVLWDRPFEVTDAACFDARIERMLQFEAAQRYPELQWMSPKRPTAALDCADCGGNGISPVAKQMDATNVVCVCGGLGWMLPEEMGDAAKTSAKFLRDRVRSLFSGCPIGKSR